MDNVDTNRTKQDGAQAGIANQDPLTIENTSAVSQTPCVFVTIPQNSITGNKGHVQSVIQQPQQSVIHSTPLQTVQISKAGNVYLLKQPINSVIQSPGGNNLQTVQVITTENLEEHVEPVRKRQLLARRPSYKKILNDLSGVDNSGFVPNPQWCNIQTRPDQHGSVVSIAQVDTVRGDQGSSDSSQEDNSGVGTITVSGSQFQTTGLLKVIPASSLQIAGHGDGLQAITMTNAASAGGAIVHYAPGSSDGQIIVPVAASDLSSLKIATSMGNVGQSVVLATTSASHTGDTLVEEASRKREIRLMKNREAARECRAKKKEYIKCLENRVAVLENQNKTLVEELQTLKNLYKLSDVKESNLI